MYLYHICVGCFKVFFLFLSYVGILRVCCVGVAGLQRRLIILDANECVWPVACILGSLWRERPAGRVTECLSNLPSEEGGIEMPLALRLKEGLLFYTDV